MQVTTIGIDLAKRVFHLCALDDRGEVAWNRRLMRDQLEAFLAQEPPCVVAMEACGGAHDWGRRFMALGHDVRLLPAAAVKPFCLRHKKNDRVDARAIAEASRRPELHAVPVKSLAQQELQTMVRLRAGLVADRTRLANRLRGLLMEFGLVLPQGLAALRRRYAELGTGATSRTAWTALSPATRALFDGLYEEILAKDERIKAIERQLIAHARDDRHCRRAMTVPGIGPIIATAFVAATDISGFAGGRGFAAWLGLVPRQHSTGGKPRLLGISKHGNRSLRALLINGARSLLWAARRQQQPSDRLTAWAKGLLARLHWNVATVAVANKLARILWAVLAKHTDYRPQPV